MAGKVDPWLHHPSWRNIVKYWQGELKVRPLACARCGGAILPGRGPAGLDVGHIVDRDFARRNGWTPDQANSLGNTQPEHSHCNRSAGTAIANTRRYARPIEADEW